MTRKRVAILISGNGSNMMALLSDMRDLQHPAELVLVLSDVPGAGGLKKAAQQGVPVAVVEHEKFAGDRQKFETELTRILSDRKPDIICLAGFMRILSAGFISQWHGRMLNMHPSLLPLFRGLHTHRRALAAGMAVHGCTVHEVAAEVDGGKILGQAVVAIEDGDTPEALAARLLPVEHKLYAKVLRRFAAGDRRRVTSI